MNINNDLALVLRNIPSGICVYRVEGERLYPLFHNPAFFEILGYSEAHRREVEREMTFLGVHPDDLPAARAQARTLLCEGGALRFTCRIYHDKRREYRWIHVEGTRARAEDGTLLLYGVYSDVTEQKRLERETSEARSKLDHLVNSIPGGIGSYRMEGRCFKPLFISDGVPALSGHSREEYEARIQENALDLVYGPDRQRVIAAAVVVAESGADMEVSCRVPHRDGRLIWIHMHGRRIAATPGGAELSVVFTGMFPQARLFESMANETADGIYVIDKETYELLYVNEYKEMFTGGKDCLGKKCYAVLHGKDAPCAFCTLRERAPDGEEHEMRMEERGRFYLTRFRETLWNGIPAYVKYVRDVTEQELTRREKERRERYFETLVKNLPGGVAVVRYDRDGSMTPEFLSDGFATMMRMTPEECWAMYRNDATAGLHPDDRERVEGRIAAFVAGGHGRCELPYRLLRGDGSYVWVKGRLSLIRDDDGGRHLYAVYQDMTQELEEKERLRAQYQELILQHYRAPGPNTLLLGHCNITQGEIQDIQDHTGCDLLRVFGAQRDDFFRGVAGFIVEEAERAAFLADYLSAPALAAFARGEQEKHMDCFIRLPNEERGRYARFQMNMVATPGSGDVTGILSVSDVTEHTIADRILRSVSVSGYDFIVDLDLQRDRYITLLHKEGGDTLPARQGSHSQRMASLLENRIAPRDQAQYRNGLDPQRMLARLRESGAYSFAYSMLDEKGDIRTKNITVSPIDLRLGRVCLVRADITEPVREQQGLLNMMAYTFEVMAYVNVHSGRLTMYTRRIVLENLPPKVYEDFDGAVQELLRGAQVDEAEEVAARLRLAAILRGLEETPAGYDFIFSHHGAQGQRYKQVNILWGDADRRMVCLVQADVTDILTAERESKKALEQALVLAREANRAKSEFLSSMSHDIRTPMNAIMGMTALAIAHRDDPARVADCLQKIAISSRHLLALINDILDMSKIERGQISLGRMAVSLPGLLEQVEDIIAPQARAAGLTLTMENRVAHGYFFGDPLRINQILINLLGNAVKFTPEGGRVELLAEECAPLRDAGALRLRFTVRDTGIGMDEAFIARVFDPFARERGVERVEGTGLGLSITKGLVELMGGTISVESRLNHGSVFRVELECEPAREEDLSAGTQEDPCADGEDRPFAGRCFLVAEDNAINAEILCELLRLDGAKAVVRPDGVKTVRAFHDAPAGTYDAILMDIQMPEMNGYEATRAIRHMAGRPDAAAIPIIAMTANAFAEDVQASLNAGMNGHVAKPINVSVLRETLRRALDTTHN